jgi:uncharacterized membrane protein
MLVVHILAGGIALVAGAVALSAAKGGRLHRRSGLLFVYAMVTMALGGAVIALVRGAAPSINAPAGFTTTYLVITALTAVRPGSPRLRRIEAAAMAFGFTMGMVSVLSGLVTLATATGAARGMAYPLFMFGAAGLLCARADLRTLRGGRLQGPARLARHLWRMCLAMFIATGSFFLGQAQVFPDAIRTSGLLALPVVAVIAVTAYWLWRVRARPIALRVAGSAAHRTT